MVLYNVDGKRFDTDKADFICSSKIPYKDSGYEEGLGRWRELYHTKKGNWVMVEVSCWQGTRNSAHLVDKEVAQKFILEYGDDSDIKTFCNDLEEI